ncbi:Cyclin-dependent kinases regulatory subunit [Trichinella zimbabwensis]|uniref:Cyclin-dependent kinases regulatory subunit n=2 Tax=Trichinella TaxID=6333 RepID=A0A0V1MUB4_9BILA|nr:Cyclin-dependent kinases regulatory subunit [Trichinella zimbabwensis]KRZ75038.1 Cyclin-dependent kinases regulatory subunit [Trichinella papuae]
MINSEIQYSEKYQDERGYEYRHVHLPKCLVHFVPLDRLMTEAEWRSIGIQQSRGWEHYLIHNPEPHIILFRRKIASDSINKQTIKEKQTVRNSQNGKENEKCDRN